MTTRRTREPWMSPEEYGRALPAFTVNLLVRDVARAVAFQREVLGALVRYHDEDFAAVRIGGHDVMLHADHTYDRHPWHGALQAGTPRGLGAELRVFGVDPDQAAVRARRAGVRLVEPAADKPHGWREAWIEDPDGYLWAVGVIKRS